ncbi:hypothetical protein [Marmoricola sp. RAF53]|uniref:hypothetical protein n=1 Tax=Marmoricola sp. RAF53 TaxID=3233059 RepID=UPI003F98D4DA
MRFRTTALVATGLLALGTAGGCGGPDEAAPKPTPTPTSIAQVDPGSMDLVRVAFCDLVPRKAVDTALGGADITSTSWGNGDTPPLEDAGSDLAHEFGCAWTGTDRVARAWVFARPVTAAFGGEVIADGRGKAGCTTQPAATFGNPGALQVCALSGGRTRVRHAGLFGATWLTCELVGKESGQESAQALRADADAWCVAVANSLDTER